MCFFVRESKLYMVGGEKPIAEALPEKLCIRFTVDLDESLGDRQGISGWVIWTEQLSYFVQFNEQIL